MSLTDREKAIIMTVMLKERLSSMSDGMNKTERDKLAIMFSVITVRMSNRLGIPPESLPPIMDDVNSSSINRIAMETLSEIEINLQSQEKPLSSKSYMKDYGEDNII